MIATNIYQKGIDMYRVYLLKKRKGGTEVVKGSRTNTPSVEAAKAAFLEIRKSTNYAGQNYILLMTKDKVKLNWHLFNAEEGTDSYFDLAGEFNTEAPE